MVGYTVPQRPNELYHHGILGQKWGVRRFQPYPKGYRGNGKYTGTKTVQAAESKEGTNRSLEQTIQTGKGKQNTSPAEKITRDTSNASSEAARAAHRIADKKRDQERQKAKDNMSDEVHDMSDNELQEAIRRMEMEKRYKDLSTENIQTGYDNISYILDNAATVASIAASAASVAAIIYNMKH